MFRLDSRCALVTGGTQGVGAAIAKSLAQAGCDVILLGLEPNREAETTLAACRSFDVNAAAVYEDLSLPSSQWLDNLLGKIAKLRPIEDISLLVNNAGICQDVPFLQMDHETFRKTLCVNVEAGFFLTQSLARVWSKTQRPNDWYRVLFTGSINGILSEQDHSSYDTSKGAVHAMVRSLCVALSPWGVRVNGLAPGLVVTPLTAPALAPDGPLLPWMQLHTPNRKVPDAEVCGPPALYLLSDEASHVNGQIHLVDGGMSAWQQPAPPSSRSVLDPHC
jgi:NAD(P)-dependent dehydrogenase (short-subunit alcohol dehydrogenase family)